MTDYSKVTDEELNEAIAIKLGWRKHICYVCEHSHWQSPDEGVDYNQQDAPDYTHDWRLCGELLEEMKGDGKATLTLEWSMYHHGWCVDFLGGDCYGVIAPTPQRAICEAWLAWKGAK